MVYQLPASLNNFFSAQQTGHVQPAGSAENCVLAGMFCFGSPFSGSYSCPQIWQMYFVM